MASSTIKSLVPLVLLHVLSLVHPSISAKGKGDVINRVCPKTVNPEYCVKTLSSDPRMASADLRTAATVSVELAQKKAESNLNLFNSMIQKTQDGKLKEKYNECITSYVLSVNTQLSRAKSSIESSDYNVLGSSSSSALEGAEECLDLFEAPQVAPTEFAQRNDDFIKLCNIIFNVAEALLV